MASGLSERLQNIFAKLKGKGKLTEADVNEAMREIRVAMLEADVNLAVAKDFISKVKARAIGTEVLNSLTPGQQVVKIVNEEMIALLGGEQSKLIVSSAPPTIILMAGLQGSGKTTTTGKLARLLKSQGKHPLLAAADIYRPAAIKQLQILGESQNIPVFSLGDSVSAVDIAKGAVEQAKRNGNDTVIIDTAGRLQIDEAMMDEIAAIRDAVNPTEILLVVDAMAGQEGVNVAKAFNEILALTGIVLTKLDGDTRGGVALSVKAVTGLPIKFTGTGEKIEALEPFYPDRMASRILGMGDVLSLIEKAQAAVDQEKMVEMEKRLAKNQFTLEDFADQMEQMRNMGGISEIAGMLPGMEKQLKGVQLDEKQFDRMDAIIKSMTPEERRNPSVINSSRRQRIARGSGTQVQDVNRLLKQYAQTQTMLKQMNSSGAMKRMKKGKGKGGFKFPFF
ncbi:MAG: signal recognition particle protein [Firmicutes bacterium]|nr:signal recognition particle protein [Bacillota bacterium]